jgi:hypothetical protein
MNRVDDKDRSQNHAAQGEHDGKGGANNGTLEMTTSAAGKHCRQTRHRSLQAAPSFGQPPRFKST